MTELQQRLLKLLKVLDELCRKHDVEYYLLGGSLIGALRHKGFIPWDDDADVIMTRNNWEKFFRLAKDDLPEGYKISAQDDDINVGQPINRLTETTTTGLFRYHLAAPEISGTQIDIFVMDPVPDTEEDERIYRDAVTEYSELSALHVGYQFRNGKNTNFIRNWERSQQVGREQALREISEKAFGYSEEESGFYAQRFAGSPHFWPKEVFGKPQYVPFEDTMLPIPARPGDCLIIGYDEDWRFIPRSGVTLSTHDFAARNYTTPSTVVWDEYEKHVDLDKLREGFIARKKAWDRQFDTKFNLELDTQLFLKYMVELKYRNILKEVDVSGALAEGDYEALNRVFEEYLNYQSNSGFLGSSALSGWKQYYRRRHRLLIDIGDEALTVVLRLLIHDQRLALAVKILDARTRIERHLTEELRAIGDTIERIKTIVSTYGCGEYDRCRELVDEGLAEEPENPFYIKHDIFLKAADELGGEADRPEGEADGPGREALRKEIERGLALIGEDADLLKMRADLFRDEGNQAEEFEIYDYLIDNTDDGIILTAIKERCEEILEEDDTQENRQRLLRCQIRCGMDVGEESEDKTEENFEPLTDTQKVKLKLLHELDQVCRENVLDYYLGGKILWQAYKYGRFIDKYGEIVVFMKPEDAIRFQEIINEGDYEGRTVESMLNSPGFHRIIMNYCDTSTLDMAVARCDTAKHPSIGITIDIIRSRESGYIGERYNRLLEKGWESRTSVRKTDWKTKFSRDYIDRMCSKLGVDKAARKLFLTLTKGNERSSSKERFVKVYNGKRRYFPAAIFDTISEIELEGHRFRTVGEPEEILAIQHGQDWEEREYSYTSHDDFTRIIDPDISADEYREFLKEKGLDTGEFQALWIKNNWDYQEITAVTRMARDYWYTLAACCDRYNMYDMYHDKKDAIIEAYRRGDPEEVRELINDYFMLARRYVRLKKALYFDREMFEILIWYMKNSDREEMAEKIQRLQKEQNWAEIKKGMN